MLGQVLVEREEFEANPGALNLHEDGVVLSNYGFGVCHPLC